MAVFSQPPTFLQLIGADGLGWLVGLKDDTTELDARKNAFNKAYVECAGLLKGYWRRRSFDYTASSSPALTVNVRAYNTPTTSGAVFDTPGRLYYRESGGMVDVRILDDLEWLERSATQTSDAGDPAFARVVQTTSATQLELSRPVSQGFIDRIGTLTLEYYIAIAHLSANGDTTILPRNLTLLLIEVAAWMYALTQGDYQLADRLAPAAERAKAEFLRHDVTRLGRAFQQRPAHNYLGTKRRLTRDYR